MLSSTFGLRAVSCQILIWTLIISPFSCYKAIKIATASWLGQQAPRILWNMSLSLLKANLTFHSIPYCVLSTSYWRILVSQWMWPAPQSRSYLSTLYLLRLWMIVTFYYRHVAFRSQTMERFRRFLYSCPRQYPLLHGDSFEMIAMLICSIDPNGYLMENVMASLGLLAQMAASPSFETLGRSLNDNWNTSNQSIGFQANIDGWNATQETYNTSAVSVGNDTSLFSAVQDSFNAILDDIIGGFGAAQLYWETDMNSKSVDTIQLPLDSQYSAIRLGQDGYMLATLAINLFILVLAIEESIRTRYWTGLPLLDNLSSTSMVVASSAGGTGVAEACTQKYKQGEALEKREWKQRSW